MSRYSSSHRRRDGHSRDRSRSPRRKRDDQSTTEITVNLDGAAAEVLANDDEEFNRLKDTYGSVHVKREMEGFNLKITFSGPDSNVLYDIMMALFRYLENTKNIKCPR